MLSLVNYGASDSENDTTDEEEVLHDSTEKNGEEIEDDLAKSVPSIKFPIRNQANQIIEEDDDEFLYKKEIPDVKPPPPAQKLKEKVKIMIPKLSDFKDDLNLKNIPTVSKKTGLLGMLPKPTNYIGPSPKPQIVTQGPLKPSSRVTKKSEDQSTSSSNIQIKKIGFIPYTLMDHKKAADTKKASKTKDNESESDEEESSSFFTFSSNDDHLPKVNEEEIKSLIANEAKRLEQKKRQNEESQDFESDHQHNLAQYNHQQQHPDIDKEAFSALMGGNKAKRSKFEDIQIVDLSANDVLPNREEWMRKTLAGETGYIATGTIDEKGPALAKRKHQLTYLAARGEKNMAELEAMWAANRQNNREARSKYGF